MGVKNKIYTLQELVRPPLVFCLTGVTDGPFAKGIQKNRRTDKSREFLSGLYKKYKNPG